jgi:hypothetical protein
LLAKLRENKTELLARLQSGDSRTFPPSFAQRRFFTLQKLNPTDAFYNVPFVFRLTVDLKGAVLRAALNESVKRHESLRTTLEERDGSLVQVIAPEGEVNLTEADLDGPLLHRLRTGMDRPFDLGRQSGLRVLLLRKSPGEYYLQFVLHNTLFDQSSLLVLLQELSENYGALLSGRVAALPSPAQCTDYATWQQSLMASGNEGRVKYWREWFSRGQPPAWQWRGSKSGPASNGFRAHVTWQHYSPELTSKITSLARKTGGTVYLTLLTVYAMILSRYTGCDDVTVGTTYGNRHARFASLIGATIDTPALRIDMTDDPAVLLLLARTRAVVGEALTWQDVPFDYIAPQLERKASGPLFRMVFSYFAEVPHDRLRLPGVEVEFREELSVNDISRPDLYLVFWMNQTSSGEALSGYWMHKSAVFEPGTAQRMNRQFQALITATVENPGQQVRTLLNALPE